MAPTMPAAAAAATPAPARMRQEGGVDAGASSEYSASRATPRQSGGANTPAAIAAADGRSSSLRPTHAPRCTSAKASTSAATGAPSAGRWWAEVNAAHPVAPMATAAAAVTPTAAPPPASPVATPSATASAASKLTPRTTVTSRELAPRAAAAARTSCAPPPAEARAEDASATVAPTERSAPPLWRWAAVLAVWPGPGSCCSSSRAYSHCSIRGSPPPCINTYPSALQASCSAAAVARNRGSNPSSGSRGPHASTPDATSAPPTTHTAHTPPSRGICASCTRAPRPRQAARMASCPVRATRPKGATMAAAVGLSSHPSRRTGGGWKVESSASASRWPAHSHASASSARP
mmetsp:Transcript_32869/g.106274  ORF Transcript_32869/g.106274 Transcript_32869/m.106274 type:complete len:349 (+) Transcript_32869:1246-2292(+)|eukprot:scaffold21582_cov97-Isochrysis_galbana.AAC.3